MTNIISMPFYEQFIQLCTETRSCMKICAPYVKVDIFAEMLEVKRKNVSLDLITKVSLRNFHNKSSDLGVLQKTIECGGNIFNCSNLHAKVYVFDDSKCIITSANLTSSGLKRNIECGLLTDDDAIVSSAVKFCENIMTKEDVGKITDAMINDISKLLIKIPLAPRIEYPRLDLTASVDNNLSIISKNLHGWKRDVFLSLSQFDETFSSAEVSMMAQQLHAKYPRNNNREAKIRQVLQQLRDLGLVEFSSPGVYKKLWV